MGGRSRGCSARRSRSLWRPDGAPGTGRGQGPTRAACVACCPCRSPALSRARDPRVRARARTGRPAFGRHSAVSQPWSPFRSQPRSRPGTPGSRRRPPPRPELSRPLPAGCGKRCRRRGPTCPRGLICKNERCPIWGAHTFGVTFGATSGPTPQHTTRPTFGTTPPEAPGAASPDYHVTRVTVAGECPAQAVVAPLTPPRSILASPCPGSPYAASRHGSSHAPPPCPACETRMPEPWRNPPLCQRLPCCSSWSWCWSA